MISVSEHDEFDLTEPARAFSVKLRESGISHEFDVTEPGHMAGGSARTERVLGFVISKIAPASP